MPHIKRLTAPRVRGARRERPKGLEYTSRWDRFSRLYRRQNPFCKFCLEKGIYNLGSAQSPNVVDHKYPVTWGGEMFPGAGGVMTLCRSHHDGTKAQMEGLARRLGREDELVLWCDDPMARPRVV